MSICVVNGALAMTRAGVRRVRRPLAVSGPGRRTFEEFETALLAGSRARRSGWKLGVTWTSARM